MATLKASPASTARSSAPIRARERAAGIERVAVVLGHHAEEIQRAANLTGVEVVINRDYQQGQTSSLQAGLRALEGDELEAVLLCLVDHPAVSADVMRALVEAFKHSRAPVFIPTFKGQRGHPVVIASEVFDKLLALGPDEGANSVIRTFRDKTRFVDVDDPGILLDVDEPDAYGRLEIR